MTWTQTFKAARGDAQTLSELADFNPLIELAEQVGRDLQRDGVSSRQIRVLLSETTAGVSRIRRGRTLGMDAGGTDTPPRDMQDRAAQREAALLNISLVYNAGRAKSGEHAIRQLTDLMGEVTRAVKTFEDFKVLRKFSEAVMAYFKFHGGK
ncbi:type III-A CRISPR-associated protein Csm2 [Deinococcus sp. JMULE3]|uniref:type III-A CRISPR-associated protein Csm2 n=1 Tax=Deinococcus sp. JMULE3 TaxID=2518341 RepID=UPI0015762906|nr:type III-A CRISPR-associated protein Csm2 [Deinococcus sp. JMULE3]